MFPVRGCWEAAECGCCGRWAASTPALVTVCPARMLTGTRPCCERLDVGEPSPPIPRCHGQSQPSGAVLERVGDVPRVATARCGVGARKSPQPVTAGGLVHRPEDWPVRLAHHEQCARRYGNGTRLGGFCVHGRRHSNRPVPRGYHPVACLSTTPCTCAHAPPDDPNGVLKGYRGGPESRPDIWTPQRIWCWAKIFDQMLWTRGTMDDIFGCRQWGRPRKRETDQ